MSGPKEVFIKKMIEALPSLDLGAWKGSEELARLAKCYVWWKTVDRAMENPKQIIAQVMKMGEWDDVCRLVDCVGDEGLCRVHQAGGSRHVQLTLLALLALSTGTGEGGLRSRVARKEIES